MVKPKPEPQQQLPTISLFADASTGVPEPKTLGEIYAPFGRLMVWQCGEELRLKAIALDREFSGDQEGWGITDGSAGLRGRIIKSDDMAEIKLLAATFLSGAADALTEKEQTIFGTVNSRSVMLAMRLRTWLQQQAKVCLSQIAFWAERRFAIKTECAANFSNGVAL